MIIYGASGHGKVIHSILSSTIAFFDDNSFLESFNGLPVYRYNSNFKIDELVIIAIGDNKIRKRIASKLIHKIAKVEAQSSCIDPSVNVGSGCHVLQMTLLQVGVSIGSHTIINSASSVDHDCKIGDFVHIAPHSTLCGNVTIGEGTLIGAGSVILPGLTIGSWCTIGAGSVVTKDIPDNSIAYGNPCRILKNER